MSKSSKGKKSKVPKLTEAEYAAYISSLRGGEREKSVQTEGVGLEKQPRAQTIKTE